VIAAIIIMYRGCQHLTSPRIKHQVGLVLWGIRVSVGLYAIAFLLPKLFPFKTSDTVVYFLTILALLIGAGSIAWAIIKYQFLDISQSISRRFLFSICSALFLGVYLVIYDQSKKIISAVVGFQLPILEVVFIILAVILFQPALSGIRYVINKLFGRDKSDYDHILQTLSHDILTIMDLDQLKEKITTTLTESMMLENVHLIIENKDGDFQMSCEHHGKIQVNKFSRNGEFINLIRSVNKPIGYDEIISQISKNEEVDLLNKLNCYLLIPLAHRGDLNGILCLGNKLTRTSFSAEDATLLNVLSDQIAIAIENIDLHQEKLEKQHIEKELSVAREIQKMLLPYQIPEGKNFEISAMNIPSKEVGGDYYDFIQLDKNHVGIAIGDISGKGIPGAMLMSNLQATLRASAWQIHQPAEVMKKINNQIANTTSSEKFATFFYGILDSKKLTFTFSNAGHNYPIIKKRSGQYCHLTDGGLVIGVKPDFDYNQTRINLSAGDTLVFYTDGITEALNPEIEEFGEQKLLDIIVNYPYGSAEELRNHIYEEMISFTKGESQYDDLTLIVLQILL
ncbi:MAG: SpoIIE family protein phosphatase, partial [bacterium]